MYTLLETKKNEWNCRKSKKNQYTSEKIERWIYRLKQRKNAQDKEIWIHWWSERIKKIKTERRKLRWLYVWKKRKGCTERSAESWIRLNKNERKYENG